MRRVAAVISCPTRTVGMYTLRGYLLVAVLMLIVKGVQAGIGHG